MHKLNQSVLAFSDGLLAWLLLDETKDHDEGGKDCGMPDLYTSSRFHQIGGRAAHWKDIAGVGAGLAL